MPKLERTDLLRYTINTSESVANMIAKNKKNAKKIDLSKMRESERNQLIKEVKERLRQKILEAKLWRTLLEVENLTVNGNTVYKGDERLTGFSF